MRNIPLWETRLNLFGLLFKYDNLFLGNLFMASFLFICSMIVCLDTNTVILSAEAQRQLEAKDRGDAPHNSNQSFKA